MLKDGRCSWQVSEIDVRMHLFPWEDSRPDAEKLKTTSISCQMSDA